MPKTTIDIILPFFTGLQSKKYFTGVEKLFRIWSDIPGL